MSTQATEDQRVNKRFLVKWKLMLSLTIKGNNQTIQGNLADISTQGATALIENNLPAKSTITVIFVIPPKTLGEPPQTIQINGKLIYCVLGGHGLFRAGIQFDHFIGQGLAILEKELSSRIPLSN
jgi:hypothetical protein